MSLETSIEGSVVLFLIPEDSESAESVELEKGGTIGISNKEGDYEEVIVFHRPADDEDSDDGVEIYRTPIEQIEGTGHLPIPVDISESEITGLVDSDEPYVRTITDRYGKRYILGVQFIGATVLREAS
jgi:hypothetical protein